MFYMHNVGWGWWLVMSIGMVAFWALVIYGIIWLIRGGQSVERRDASRAESPREILNRRLANGEISVEEYRRLLETLDEVTDEHAKAA